MTFQIEQNIPMPTKPERNGYPFADLKVGDSFVVNMNGKKSWAGVYAAITKAQDKHQIKLTTRLIDETNRRIWRVA
jgi:hypothetical protein